MSFCTILELPALDRTLFDRLLEWLDDGEESHGARYLEMRARLVSYFENRDRLSADELADETLNRIARTLEREMGPLRPGHRRDIAT